MEKIASFTVNHLNLLPGVYVSRKDNVGGNVITTFDLRMTRPNYEPVMNTAEVHTIEHLAATFLRNHKEYGEKIIYFGPMGCRTGFYLILAGEYESKDIVPLLKELYTFMSEFEGDVPGACARDCEISEQEVSDGSIGEYFGRETCLSGIVIHNIHKMRVFVAFYKMS